MTRLLIGRWLTAVLLACAAAGCASHVRDPSFDVTVNEADWVLREMAAQRVPAPRPILVLGGWRDFLATDRRLRRELASGLLSPRIISIGFADCDDFETCRLRLLHRVQEAFPSRDPTETVDVDVVGFSMGGLVARYAAAPPGDAVGRRLRIHRLFTISTPHTGARLADLSFISGTAHDMQPGSDFLKQLRERERARPRYPVCCYVRLDDKIVGPEHAGFMGQGVWWVSNLPWQFAHIQAYGDPRIIADILRRLRGEPPLTTTPPSPLPP